MLVQATTQVLAEEESRHGAIRRVLVVEDSRAQRRILTATLGKQGYDVIGAESAEEALAFLTERRVDLILSDWMMPGMNGLEFCAKVRALSSESYIYFILLTSKNESGAAARGLDNGADDFLTKPVTSDELRARIKAGNRIVTMQRDLSEKNRLISTTLEEIRTLYEAVDRDLVEARKLQQSLVRERWRDFSSAEIALLLKPSGHVGGDLVGFFEAGENKVAAYSIDVSGHGIASALMTARLASFLSDGAPEQNIALFRDSDGRFVGRPPSEVATLLNALMIDEMRSDLYFTIAIAYLDLETGTVDIAQCGHPNPVVVRANGEIEFHGQGGLPIGLIEEADFQQWRIDLSAGDRLLLYSDGFTECARPSGEMLDEDGFACLIGNNDSLQSNAFLEALVWDLDLVHAGKDFTDDLSCVMIEYKGVGHTQPE